MIPYLSERENAVEQINSICMRLFDTWCEHRSVTSLAYLLHCWPLTDSEPSSIRRLGETLWELRKTHDESLGGDVVRILLDLADWVDEILLHASAPKRLVASG
jgi:hypothetical protein